MTTKTNVSVLGGPVLNAGPQGVETMYGKLPPLNPDDLKLPPPPPSAANTVTDRANAISIREVWEEMKMKTREMIMGSSVSGVLSAMRVVNFTVAGCMIALAVAQIVETKSVFSVMADALSVIYTMYSVVMEYFFSGIVEVVTFIICCACLYYLLDSFFALLLTGYELRTAYIDKMLRGSFGFMYSPWGRCLFLSMISIFPFGMCGIYGMLVSLAGFTNAYFNYFIIMKHPSFTRGVPDYTPPVKLVSAKSATITEEDMTV